jgi:hypothetical protein
LPSYCQKKNSAGGYAVFFWAKEAQMRLVMFWQKAQTTEETTMVCILSCHILKQIKALCSTKQFVSATSEGKKIL